MGRQSMSACPVADGQQVCLTVLVSCRLPVVLDETFHGVPLHSDHEKNVLMEQKNEGIFTCNDNCLKKCCILKLAGFHKAIFFGLRT